MRLVALGLLFLTLSASCCLAAYEPPSYPQDIGALRSISARVPEKAELGGTVDVSIDITVSKTPTEARKLWLYLERGGQVYHVQVIDPGDSAQWLPGREIQLGPYHVAIPGNIAAGEYKYRAGMYREKPAAEGKLVICPSPQPTSAKGQGAIVVTTGCFTDKYGTPHYWHINKAHTLIWDGEPFIPAGGMFIYDRDWNIVKAQIDLLKRYGVKSIYLHLGVNQPYLWKDYSDDDYRFFQQTIDYLDANGFTYGLEFQALEAKGPGYSYPGGLGVGHVKKSGTVRVEAKDPKSAAYIVVDEATGRAVGNGEARIAEGKFLEADIVVPKGADYRVCFQADRAGPDGFVMYYWDDTYQRYVKKVRDHYSKVKLGPGFRFLVDPLWNEMNTSHDFIPSAPAFAEQFTKWLEQRYGSIEKLNEAWKPVDGAWPTFSAAGSTVSIERIDDKITHKLMQYCYSRSAKRVYTVDACTSQFNYDIREFIGRSLLGYCNEIADIFKSMNDVPVIYKCFSDVDWWHINDTGLASGHDGLGMESYGTGEPMLLFMGIHAFGECEQAKKTTWLIVTETGEGNHQDISLSRNKPIGYSDRLGTMYANYNALISAGAKGIYQYNMIGGRGVQDPWTDNISRDPRQLEWLATYDRILANAPKLVDYKPTVYYRFPAHFHPCSMELWSDPCNDFANMGGWWWREPIERAQNNIWILPSFSLSPETPMHIVSLENKPASERFRDEVEQALAAGDKRITFIGFRKDLGTIPTLDRYYANQFAQNERGRRFQVLKPTSTCRILNQTWNGLVWNMIDGNVQINSEEVFGQHGYQPQDLAFGPEKPLDPYDGIFDMLGVKLLDLGPDGSWLTYKDQGVPVTVVSAKSGSLEMTLPKRSDVACTYADGTPAGETAQDGLKVELQAVDPKLTRAHYDWAPEGIMVDSIGAHDTVIVRGLDPNEAVPAKPGQRMFDEPWERAKQLPAADRQAMEASLDRATSGNRSTPLRLAAALNRAEDIYYSLNTPYIWLEGEDAKSHNFNYATLGALPELSGNAFLGLETAVKPPREVGWYATYQFDVTKAGTYQMWLRENYLSFSSPCSYQIDGSNWVIVPNTLVPRDIRVITLYNAVEDSRQMFAWYQYGGVRLAPGRHTLTIKVDQPRPKGTVLTMADDRPFAKLIDCILLTQREFEPNGRTKPYYLTGSPSTAPQVERTAAGAQPKGEQVTLGPINLLGNPSVEFDSNKDEKCDGWTPSDNDGCKWTKPEWNNIKVEGLFDINCGMREAYAELRGLRLNAGDKERTWSADEVKPQQTEQFAASGWMRVSDPAATDAFFRMQWLDWRGRVIQSDVIRPEKPSSEWQEVRGTVTRPKLASAMVFQCVMGAASKGTAWFDDMVLTAGRPSQRDQ